MHYDANWLLIVDNLSDFAHLAFVHTKTLGGSEEYAYQTRPLNIERLADGFRVERWHMNSDPPPFHKKVIPDKTDKVDRRNIGHMQVPGIFFLESMFAPAGTGAEKGNIAGARQYRNCQFMTPETRRTTHFFWNYLHNFDLDDPNIALSLLRQPARGVHGGQGDHRSAAEAVRPRARHHAAGDRRRRAAGALPLHARQDDRRRAGAGRAGRRALEPQRAHIRRIDCMPIPKSDRLTLEVTDVQAEARDVVSIELRDPRAPACRRSSAGAHLEIDLPNGMVRHYSLVNDCRERDRYVIGVGRIAGSRGGSNYRAPVDPPRHDRWR